MLLPGACSTWCGAGHLPRHGCSEAWLAGLRPHLERPGQLAVEATMLASLPALLVYDNDIHAELFEDQTLTGGDTKTGTDLQIGLAVAALSLGGVRLAGGDDGRDLEVAAESVAATGAVTALLKVAVQRERPQSETRASFPSGHTSISFASATFLARTLADQGDEWYWKLGYASLLPATWVGLSRVEGNRHFLADVVAGALIGVFATNTIYDAHYGAGSGQGIFGAPEGWSLEVAPAEGGGIAFGLSVRF